MSIHAHVHTYVCKYKHVREKGVYGSLAANVVLGCSIHVHCSQHTTFTSDSVENARYIRIQSQSSTLAHTLHHFPCNVYKAHQVCKWGDNYMHRTSLPVRPNFLWQHIAFLQNGKLGLAGQTSIMCVICAHLELRQSAVEWRHHCPSRKQTYLPLWPEQHKKWKHMYNMNMSNHNP